MNKGQDYDTDQGHIWDQMQDYPPEEDNIHSFQDKNSIFEGGGALFTGIINILKFGYPHLTLNNDHKVKSEHIRRFTAHDYLFVGLPL